MLFQRKPFTTEFSAQNQASRPSSRVSGISPTKNKGTFCIRPIKVKQTSNDRSDRRIESGRNSRISRGADIYNTHNATAR